MHRPARTGFPEEENVRAPSRRLPEGGVSPFSRGRSILAAIMILAAFPATTAALNESESYAIFEAANALYQEGDFDGAAQRYRELLDSGEAAQDSAALHFNLGNALYKMNRIGPAILEFERAARLAPGDGDVEANLSFLRALIADKPSTARTASTEAFLAQLLAFTTADQDALVLTALWLLMGSLWGGWILLAPGRMRRAMLWGIAVSLPPVLLVSGALGIKMWRSADLVEGVVLAERVDVRSGPGEDHMSLFAIHEGLKVRVRSEQGVWSWISLEDGLNGWVPNASFERI